MSNNSRRRPGRNERQDEPQNAEDTRQSPLAASLGRSQQDINDARLLLGFAGTNQGPPQNLTQAQQGQEQQQQTTPPIRRQLQQENNERFAALATTPGTIAGTDLEADVITMMTALGAGATVVQALIYLEAAGWDIGTAQRQWAEDRRAREGAAPAATSRARPFHRVEARFLRNGLLENLSKDEANPLPDWAGLTRTYNSYFDGVFLPGVQVKSEGRTLQSVSAYLNRMHLGEYGRGVPVNTRHVRARAKLRKKKQDDFKNFWDRHGGPPSTPPPPSGGAGGGQGIVA